MEKFMWGWRNLWEVERFVPGWRDLCGGVEISGGWGNLYVVYCSLIYSVFFGDISKYK